jgi:two-component system, chemotaxis family, protein-glutamate methylesterase/glutaminase
MNTPPIRVLIVDDSALVRSVLKQGLSMDPAIEVVGAAPDPYIARDLIVQLKPDVMTLDVEMPRMDGVEFLKKLMPQWPLPVIMVSSLTEQGKQITIQAMEFGALDFVTKPRAGVAQGLNDMMQELRLKIKQVAHVNVSFWKHRTPASKPKILTHTLAETTDKVIAIGASTGGTEAIKHVITQLSRATPGIVIVQHMPAGFTKIFAERLNSLCEMNVKEAEDGDRIMIGQVLVAPGGHHMQVKRSGGQYRVHIFVDKLVNGHMPSVEVLMDSVAHEVGNNAIGVMLTGMGADGADAMKRMHDAGAKCIAQDEASSVVFGMPKEAFKRGGAQKLVPLPLISKEIIDLLGKDKV